MPKTMLDLIEQYVEAVRKIYGSHVRQIILYGSYARGDYKSTSDIDFCIIVKERPSHYISIYIIRNVWLQPAG